MYQNYPLALNYSFSIQHCTYALTEKSKIIKLGQSLTPRAQKGTWATCTFDCCYKNKENIFLTQLRIIYMPNVVVQANSTEQFRVLLEKHLQQNPFRCLHWHSSKTHTQVHLRDRLQSPLKITRRRRRRIYRKQTNIMPWYNTPAKER